MSQVQTQDKAVCISLHDDTIAEKYESISASPTSYRYIVEQTEYSYHGRLTSLEGKLN